MFVKVFFVVILKAVLGKKTVSFSLISIIMAREQFEIFEN